MAYSSIDDIAAILDSREIIQLTTTDEHRPEDLADAQLRAKVAEVIERADGEINGLIAARYVTPRNPTPGILHTISKMLGVYYLYRNKPHLKLSDQWVEDIKYYRSILQQIAKGSMDLPEPDESTGESSPAADNTISVVTDSKPVINMEGY